MMQEHQKQIFISVAILVSLLSVTSTFAQQSPPPSTNSVTSPAKNTPPANVTTPKKPINLKSTNTTPKNKPSQTPAPSNNSTQQNSQPQTNPGFWERTEGNWIQSIVVAAFITGGFTIYINSIKRKFDREIEEQKHKWELKKIELQHQLASKAEKEKADLEQQKVKERLAEEAETKLKSEEEREKTISDIAREYRGMIVTEMCNLSICNLPNVPSSLSLDDVYVELRIREEELLRYANNNAIISVDENNPNQLLKQSQLNLTEKSTSAISPIEAVAKFSFIVVLGDPGAGKTTMLRYLALKMAKAEEYRLPYLPLYIELGEFVQSGHNSLLEFIDRKLHHNYGFPQSLEYITEQLNQGKIALLLDGLDEALGGETEEDAKAAYDLAVKEINRLKIRFSKAPIIVTCRKAGWRRGLNDFKTLEVLDFSWNQIQDFIHNWFKSDIDKEQGLKRALSSNLRMQTLAANPLILSLITIVYQQDLELPERRAKLYQRCLEVLLREWDSSRNIKRFSNFTTDRKQYLLKGIAWHFHQEEKRYFSKEELLSVIGDFLKTIDIEPKNNETILKEISAQYGLLKEQAVDWYGFLHLTFQEYLMAEGSKDRLQESLPIIIAHRRDPWYTEAILLLSGMMADATPLLMGILGYPSNTQLLPEDKLAVKDDLFHSDLLLAARCLIGTPAIQLQGLRERIIDETKSLLLKSPHTLDWENSANVLMEIGEDELENYLFTILEDSKQNQWIRKAIAIALGNYGSSQTAQRLLDFIEQEAKAAKANEIVIEGATASLIKLKANFASSRLLSVLEQQQYFYPNKTLSIKSNLAFAIGELGDQTMVADLLEILKQEEKDVALRNIGLGSRLAIVESIVRLSDSDRTFKLLSMLAILETNELTKLAISMAAKHSKHTLELIDLIIELLKDESIEWQTRFVLSESLNNIPLEKLKSLLPIVDNTNVDLRVRAGIAATLGIRNIEEVTPFLSEVIDEMNKFTYYLINKKLNKILPPSLLINNFTYGGYIWDRIARSFKSLKNDSIVPTFVGYFNSAISELDSDDPNLFVPDILGNVEGVIYAASEFKPQEISEKLIKLLSQPELVNYHNDIAELILHLVTKPLIPILLDLLSKRSEFKVSQQTWARMVYSISQESDNRETLEKLLLLLSSTTKKEIDLADEIYFAINSLSRRLNLHITADGLIEEIVI